mgnify:CR=1 FL=1
MDSSNVIDTTKETDDPFLKETRQYMDDKDMSTRAGSCPVDPDLGVKYREYTSQEEDEDVIP